MLKEKETEIKLCICRKKQGVTNNPKKMVKKISKKLKKNKIKVNIFYDEVLNLRTEYYDTEFFDLANANMAFRVRKGEEKEVATIKTDFNSSKKMKGPVFQRFENTVEIPQENSQIDISLFMSTPIWNDLNKIVERKKIFPIFYTKVKRTNYLISVKEDCKILLSIDLGKIISGEKDEPINEIELELKSGNMAQMLEIAKIVSIALPVKVENMSKYSRGLKLSNAPSNLITEYELENEKYVIPEQGEDCAESILKAVTFCIQKINNRIKKFISKPDEVENIHKLRVKIRHLRSILHFAKPLIIKSDYKKLQAALKKFIKKTGNIRETDVLIESFKEFLEQNNTLIKIEEKQMKQVLNATRQFEKTKLLVNLIEGGFTPVYLLLNEWIEKDQITCEIKIGEYTEKYISRIISSIKKSIANATVSHPKTLHKTRIKIKKLRYVRDYFIKKNNINQKDIVEKNIKKSQDVFGDINDLFVNRELAKKLLPSSDILDKYLLWLDEKEKLFMHNFENLDFKSIIDLTSK